MKGECKKQHENSSHFLAPLCETGMNRMCMGKEPHYVNEAPLIPSAKNKALEFSLRWIFQPLSRS